MNYLKFRILLLISVAAVIGCARDVAKSGGQDGGGGHAEMSSQSEVQDALQLALQMAEEPKYQQNIFYNFLGFYSTTQCEDSHCTAAMDIAEKVISGYDSAGWARVLQERHGSVMRAGPVEPAGPFEQLHQVKDELGQDAIFNSIYNDVVQLNSENFQNLLKASPLRFLAGGDCGRAIDNHSDAYVSSFSRGATLCVSLGNLQKVAPQDLLREILGLIVHEAAHLSGYQEKDAQTLQFAFIDYYDFRFGEFPIRHVSIDTRDKFDYMDWTLSTPRHYELGISYGWRTPGPKDVAAILAYGLWDFEQTPAWWDPLALEIIFRPKRAKAIWAYLYSIMNFVEKYHDWLLSHGAILPQTERDSFINVKREPMPWSKIEFFTDGMVTALGNIKENFQVLSTGKGALHCELPSKSVILYSYVSYYAEYLKNFDTLPDCHE